MTFWNRHDLLFKQSHNTYTTPNCPTLTKGLRRLCALSNEETLRIPSPVRPKAIHRKAMPPKPHRNSKYLPCQVDNLFEQTLPVPCMESFHCVCCLNKILLSHETRWPCQNHWFWPHLNKWIEEIKIKLAKKENFSNSPSSVSKMFSGFRSRCAMPRECKYSTPFKICEKYRKAWAGGMPMSGSVNRKNRWGKKRIDWKPNANQTYRFYRTILHPKRIQEKCILCCLLACVHSIGWCFHAWDLDEFWSEKDE